MKKSSTTVLLFASGLSLAAIACGGSAPAPESAADAGAAKGSSADAPADPSKPVGPKAANDGQVPSNDIVDDFEDGDSKGVEADMRGGYWYSYKDDKSTVEPGAGDFTPAEGGAAESKFSGRIAGEVTTEIEYPYVGIGISFMDPKAPYDVSACKGISFKGKKNVETNAKVRFKVGDWQTTPEGGLCQQCFNDFGADLLFTDEWVEHSILFAEMKQEPYWGEPKAAIDPKALYQLQWQVNEKGAPFDFQIDDVKLVGCGE